MLKLLKCLIICIMLWGCLDQPRDIYPSEQKEPVIIKVEEVSKAFLIYDNNDREYLLEVCVKEKMNENGDRYCSEIKSLEITSKDQKIDDMLQTLNESFPFQVEYSKNIPEKISSIHGQFKFTYEGKVDIAYYSVEI